MSTKIECDTCKRDKCPDDCVVRQVFKEDEHVKYVAYINRSVVDKVKKDLLYMNNVGSIDVMPYYLVLGDDRYQIVKFGTELRPTVSREDIKKYLETCVTKDFWMARHF